MRIKDIRIAKGITQERLGEVLGVSQNTISGWETKVRNPRTDKLPAIAAALGCSVGELYEDEAVGENDTSVK